MNDTSLSIVSSDSSELILCSILSLLISFQIISSEFSSIFTLYNPVLHLWYTFTTLTTYMCMLIAFFFKSNLAIIFERMGSKISGFLAKLENM